MTDTEYLGALQDAEQGFDYTPYKDNMEAYNRDPYGAKQRLEYEREKSIYEATPSERMKAIGSSLLENNFIGHGFNKATQWATDEKFKEDESFTKTWDFDSIKDTLANNKLDSFKYYKRMSEARSEEHRDFLVDELTKDRDDAKFVYDHISDNARITSNVLGSFIDIDTLLVGPVAGILGKGLKLSNVVKATAGVETGGALAKSYMDDDYDLAKDGLLDIAVGTFVDVSLFKAFGGSSEFKNSVEDARDNSVTDKDTIDKTFRSHEDTIKDTPEPESNAVLEFPEMEKPSERLNADIDKKIEDIKNEYVKFHKNGKQKKISKKTQKEIDARVAEMEDIRERDVNQLRWEEKKASRAEEEIEDAARRDSETTWLEKNKEKQREAQKNRDREIELAELEKKGAEYRKQLDIKHKTDTEKAELEARLAKEELELKHKREAEQRKAERKERDEKREYYTRAFTNGKYSPQSIARAEFYRMQDNLKLEAQKNLDAQSAQKAIDDLNRFEDIVNSMGKSVQDALANLGRRVKYETIDYDDIPQMLEAIAKKFPEEAKLVQDIERYITNHRIDDIDSEEILNRIMSTKFSNIPTLKKAGIISLLTIAPITAFASDGENDNALSYIPYIVAGAILYATIGRRALSSIRNNRARDDIKNLFNTVNDSSRVAAYKTGEGKAVTNMIGDTQKKLSTGFNSTFKGFVAMIARGCNAEQAKIANDIVDKLFFNPLNGKVSSLDVEKTGMVRNATQDFHNHMKAGLNEFIESKGISKLEARDKHQEIKREFNNYVSDMLDGISEVPEKYKALVDSFRKPSKTMLEQAAEVGVKGAEDALKRARENHFPRIWKFTEMRNIIKGISNPDDLVKLTQAVADTMKGGDTYKKAELLLRWMDKSGHKISDTRSDNILDILDDFIKDDADFKEMRDLLAKQGDRSSRLKDRMEIDWSKFKAPEIVINGEKRVVNVDDMVNRDPADVMDSLANNMYGNIGLANRGFPTTKSLRDAIDSLPDDISNELHSAVDVLLNIPSKRNSIAMHQMTEFAKSITFAGMMPYVAFSMVTELFKTLANAGLGNILKATKYQMGKLDKNSHAFQVLSQTGLGTSQVRNRADFRGSDQMAANDTAVWGITKLAREGQELVATWSGLQAGSDILQKANYMHHSKEFAKLVNGIDHQLVKTRLGSYGIDDDSIKMFEGDFTFSNGELQKMDIDSWSYDKQVRFNDIMVRLNQEITPDVYLGSSPLYSHTTDIGKVLGFLLSYPMNLIENQAVKDAHFLDRRTLSNNLLTVAGAYVGLVAKYEALGRDYEHEDLYMYSIMNLPAMSLFSAADSMTDPAILGFASDLKDANKALAMEAINLGD